jgi:hypothetical protein
MPYMTVSTESLFVRFLRSVRVARIPKKVFTDGISWLPLSAPLMWAVLFPVLIYLRPQTWFLPRVGSYLLMPNLDTFTCTDSHPTGEALWTFYSLYGNGTPFPIPDHRHVAASVKCPFAFNQGLGSHARFMCSETSPMSSFSSHAIRAAEAEMQVRRGCMCEQGSTCGESGLGGTRGLRGRGPDVAIFKSPRPENSARLSSGAVATESGQPIRTVGVWHFI